MTNQSVESIHSFNLIGVQPRRDRFLTGIFSQSRTWTNYLNQDSRRSEA